MIAGDERAVTGATGDDEVDVLLAELEQARQRNAPASELLALCLAIEEAINRARGFGAWPEGLR
jgi:hypothetical protein